MKIALIVALSENNVMGDSARMSLWHLGDDLKNFKKLTLNQVIIMGRRTYEAIGHGLANRVNIIVTSKAIHEDGLVVAVSPSKALVLARRYDRDIFIIGGKQVYEDLLSYVDTLHLTRVHMQVTGDISFNPFDDGSEWQLIEQSYVKANERNDYSFTEYTYRRPRQ
jgi:dihydrofolate reductase